MRNFFSGAFKDNRYLSYGFLTGILRIAQESIFSGLNNLTVNSVMDDEYDGFFGFTDTEVKEIGDKYYTYFDGEDNGFLAYAPQYGLKVVIDEDVLKKMVNEDLKNLGIDFNVEDFFNLEDDYVDWKEL